MPSCEKRGSTLHQVSRPDEVITAEFVIAEAGKLQMEIEPLTAAQIDGLLAQAYGSPRPIVQQAAELLEPAGQR